MASLLHIQTVMSHMLHSYTFVLTVVLLGHTDSYLSVSHIYTQSAELSVADKRCTL